MATAGIQGIATASISLATTASERQDFGYPLFIDAHRAFSERVRFYTSLTSVGDDFETDSQTYAAATLAFGSTPRIARLYIGRREADATLTPVEIADGSVHNVTITVNDDDFVVASYTAGALDDEEAVVDGIIADITASDVDDHITATKVGTGSSAVLTITPILSTDFFVLSSLEKMDDSYTSSEAAPDVLTAIEEEDDGWYAVTAHDHTETFVLAMGAAVEARNKMYFHSSQEQASLTTLVTPAVDTLGKMKELNYARSAGFFHHEADTIFPELAWLGNRLPYDAGSISWVNKVLPGVSSSRDPSTGKVLTATQRGYIADQRNASFVGKDRGLDLVKGGTTYVGSNGEWIDVIRGRDWLVDDIEAGMTDLAVNQQKIPYTNVGIALVSQKLTASLDRAVSRTFLEGFEVTIPDSSEIAFADKANRELNDVTFVGFLAGAIHEINITGTLTYSEE